MKTDNIWINIISADQSFNYLIKDMLNDLERLFKNMIIFSEARE